MSVQHHVLSHVPGAACGVSIFRYAYRDTVTVVITELPDNPGPPVELSFYEALGKVRRTYLSGVATHRIECVYRRIAHNKEDLFMVRYAGNGTVQSWQRLDSLDALVSRSCSFVKNVSIPAFRPFYNFNHTKHFAHAERHALG